MSKECSTWVLNKSDMNSTWTQYEHQHKKNDVDVIYTVLFCFFTQT